MIDGVVRALRDAGFAADSAGQHGNLAHVRIADYPLPEQTCAEPTGVIALPLPVTFPQAAPYGFFALTPISRRHGAWRNISSSAPFPSAQFFSRRCPTWNPAKHDVFTYLGFVNGWLAAP